MVAQRSAAGRIACLGAENPFCEAAYLRGCLYGGPVNLGPRPRIRRYTFSLRPTYFSPRTERQVTPRRELRSAHLEGSTERELRPIGGTGSRKCTYPRNPVTYGSHSYEKLVEKTETPDLGYRLSFGCGLSCANLDNDATGILRGFEGCGECAFALCLRPSAGRS